MQRTVRTVVVVMAMRLWCGVAQGQSLPARVLGLADIPGVAGHEGAVPDAVRAGLPAWATPRVDEIGNLVVTLGSGRPSVALVADLDEGGYVVSRITDDGFLRLHRHTGSPGYALADQYVVGQPVLVRTATGALVQGMTATPSAHLSRLVDPAGPIANVSGVSGD